MKTLLVLRHAKSSWDDAALDDHERPLNKRGQRDAPRMGSLVRERGLIPDVVISCDAVRARLTAEAVVEAARYGGEILLDRRLHLAGPADVLSLLRTVGEKAETVMIVGHNPGLEELVGHLTGERGFVARAALLDDHGHEVDLLVVRPHDARPRAGKLRVVLSARAERCEDHQRETRA
jgi:phosphohistidine phosphatase